MRLHSASPSTALDWRKRVAFALLAVVVGCGERAVTAVNPTAESAVRSTARAHAVSSTVSISAISVETRYWDGSAVSPQTGPGAEAKFASLPSNVAGYSNAPVAVYSLDSLTNRSLVTGGASANLATRYQVSIAVSLATTVSVKFGPDFGAGGAMLVDGSEVAAKWTGLWSGLSWLDPTQYLEASIRLSKGTHVISVVGFENCCDGGVIAAINGGAGYVPVSIQAPPPVTYDGITSLQTLSIETRYWNGASFPQTGAGATATFEALPTNVAGYTNAAVRVTALTNNQSLVANGANANIGVRYRFVLTTVGNASKVSVRVAPDFGAGGVMLVDGVEVASNWTNLCCGLASSYPTFFIAAEAMVLQPGTHVIEVVGFENCCDAVPGAILDFGTGLGWQNVNGLVPAIPTYALAVSRTGAGVVTSSPAGIACGSVCSAPFDLEARVTLSAVADPGYVFAGWTGACAGTGACTVTIAGATSVAATFTRPVTALTVAPSGTGTGRVTSTPAGIDCGASCTASFPEGTLVTLTAVPAAGSSFEGWGAACVGTGPCTVTAGTTGTVAPVFTKLADATPPSLSCVATPSVLTSVNHKLQDISVSVAVSDAGSGVSGFTLISVLSNEPPNRAGDGTTISDIVGWTVGTADTAGQLRAERSGTLTDRIYTFTYGAVDNAGNATTASCTVTVPHDSKK